MSDHAEKKKDDKPADAHGNDGEKKKGGGVAGLLAKTPVLIGGAMMAQSVVVLLGFKLLVGGPKTAEAVDLKADTATHAADDKKDDAHGEKPDAHGEAKKADDGHGAAKKDDGHGAPAKADDGHGEKADAHGDGDAKAEPPADPKKQVELVVVEFRAPNKASGKTFLYDVSIYAVCKSKNKAALETAFKDRSALIKDRVRTIIAQSDPDKLGGGAEPGLETLRRQVRYQLERLVGENLIDEILVPRCIGYRTDF